MEEKMTSLIGYILEEMRAQENRVETIRNLMYDGYSQGEINDILATAQHMAELQYHHELSMKGHFADSKIAHSIIRFIDQAYSINIEFTSIGKDYAIVSAWNDKNLSQAIGTIHKNVDMYEVISYHVETEREYESLLDIVEYMVANVQWSPELKVAAIS